VVGAGGGLGADEEEEGEGALDAPPSPPLLTTAAVGVDVGGVAATF